MKILIVHKNEFLCRQWVKRLKAAGYDCYFAMNHERAWKAVTDKNIDMIIGETTMPNEKGMKFLDRVNRMGMMKPDVILLDSLEKMKRVRSEKEDMDELFLLDEVLNVIAHFEYVRNSKKAA